MAKERSKEAIMKPIKRHTFNEAKRGLNFRLWSYKSGVVKRILNVQKLPNEAKSSAKISEAQPEWWNSG